MYFFFTNYMYVMAMAMLFTHHVMARGNFSNLLWKISSLIARVCKEALYFLQILSWIKCFSIFVMDIDIFHIFSHGHNAGSNSQPHPTKKVGRVLPFLTLVDSPMYDYGGI